MRFVITLAIAALGATSAVAQSSMDRYGGAPSSRPGAQPVETPQLRELSWASKGSGQATALKAPPAPQRPEPMALARQYVGAPVWAARDLPPPPSARGDSRQPATYQRFEPQSPYFARQAPAAAPPVQVAALTAPKAQAQLQSPAQAQALPASLYSAPPALRPPVLAGGPPSTAPRKAPARIAGGASDPSPAPVVTPAPQQVAQAAPHAGEQVHFYSLHRAYGLTPDAIPEQPTGDRYVLLGPADGARAQGLEGGSVGRDDDDDDTPPAKRDRPF